MRKRILGLILGCSFVAALTGCGNYELIDTMYEYDKAIISIPDGTVVECEIKKWTDYEGEQVQIYDTQGNVYLVSSYNCVLMRENYFE